MVFVKGVHTLPPYSLGFRHLTDSPLYFYHGRLYRIPPSEQEHGAFTVESDSPHDRKAEPADSSPRLTGASPSPGKHLDHSIAWPRGGHNYYNDRDMENIQRRMRWLDLTLHGEAGWQERYLKKLNEWEKKWGRDADDPVI